jgi:deoxyribose-phosphate aldolase
MSSDFGRYIDHTLLRADCTAKDVRRLCAEAIEHSMTAVCVFPSHVSIARGALQNSLVKIAAVIAFPFGATLTTVKETEMRATVSAGADEADVVINISCLKSGDEGAVEEEMHQLTAKARTLGVRIKFIMETAYLGYEEKLKVCKIANRVRPDFMKTSTGFAPAGATVEDVRLMRDTLLPDIQIKAAGGIRSHKDAIRMLQAGASRLGTSSGIRILQEARSA